MHDPVAQVGGWLKSVLNVYYQYHAVPGNLPVLKPTWEKLGKLFDHWLQVPHVVHEYPDARFDASHPRVAYSK
jgi:RNA-directed DNA polymerase